MLRYEYVQHPTTGEKFAAEIDGAEIVAMSTILHHSEVNGDPANHRLKWLPELLPLSAWKVISTWQGGFLRPPLSGKGDLNGH
jgi:hypothetical protein